MGYKQVIVVRTDTKMSRGKLAAQVAHASLAGVDKVDKKILSSWKKTGQKKIVLKVNGLEELMKVKKECDKNKIPNAFIADAGLTELEPGTITALAIGPDEDKKIDKITGRLPLLK